ncbi:MAG: GAF domain-containing protein, partial [Chloroflexi bacterium]|nr:GAF domain-containing protein [Chloroflexota bacterium]
MASEPRTYVYGEWMATLVRWATLILAFLLNNVVGGTGPMESTLQNALILVGAILNLILTLALWRGFQPTRRFCRLSVVLDILFLSLIIYLRGGLFSTTYVLYFPVIFATAIRFGLSESLLYALLIDITYAGVVLAAEPGGPGALSSLGWAQLIIRVLVLAGAAGISGLLADREKALRAQWIASDRRATEAQRQLQELSMVQEINQLILQHPSDLGRVLAGVSQVVQSRLDCTLVSICLSQPGGAETDSYYVSDGNTDAPRPLRYPLAAGIGYQVFQTGEALNVPDVTQHPGYEAVFAQTRAELCVPMRIKDRVLGVIEAISEQPHVFGASDERVLSIVAGQAAMAVENAHLFTASQRQVAELTILNQIGQALGTTLHQDELLELIYQQASRVMDTRNFYIAMYDEATESVSFPLAVRDGQRQQWRTYRRRNGPAEYVVRQRQSLLIAREVAQRFQELGIDFPGQIPNSWLGVPMVVGDQVLGVMALQSHEPGHSYDQDHQRLLATIAGQAAVALENTRLYAETRRQAERSIILKWVSTMVDAFADPQGALDGIAASTRTALGCSSAVILAREPGRSALSLVAAQGITTAQREQLQQWAPDPDSPTATLTGTRWSIEDVRTQSLAGAPWTDFENWQAWAEVPLRGRQEILGCLLTGYEQPHHLTEQEDELLVALAAQAAVALETARLMQKTERRARELSTLYEVGQIITSSLDLDTVLDRIMHQAVDLLEVEAGSLVLVDRASGELVFRIALGTKGSQVQGLRLPPGTGVVGQ